MTDRAAPVRRPPRSRGFLWQGVLILLPVVVLAAIGFISIRQDKALAQGEAAERARTLAEEVADSLWAALNSAARPGGEFTFQVNAAWQLVFPPPSAPWPQPAPLPTNELSPDQFVLWQNFVAEDAAGSRVAAGREFLGTHPPERFAAAARFRLAGLLTSNDASAALALFSELSRAPSSITGETGLPLAPLAQLKWIELTRASDSSRAAAVSALRSMALSNPSAMTPFLLERAAELNPVETNRWQTEWERHELLRALHGAAVAAIGRAESNSTALPRFVWFHTDDPEESLWRATRIETNGLGATYSCRVTLDDELAPPYELGPPSPRLSPRLRPRVTTLLSVPHTSFSIELTNAPPDPLPAAVLSVHRRLPAYFGLSLDVAGLTLINTNHLREVVLSGAGGKGGGRHWRSVTPGSPLVLLAQARRFDEGIEVLRVGIHLTGPQLLYERQHNRTVIFGLLILTATVTSIIGFAAARRAFLRQQQLSEMKSNFVSSVSHELRAPIASVRLMAENLERGKIADAGKQRDYFRFIIQECRRLGTLIENVLDFSRIEQGRKQYDFEPTDVAALLQQTVQLMEPAAAVKNVTLRIEAPPAGSGLRSGELAGPETGASDATAPLLDGPALQQALINLLDNAIKHSPPGSTVLLGYIPPLSSGPSYTSRITFYVQDHGPGIPVSEHARIFERFYRRGSEMRRDTQGVGIGLSIVKHIAEAHGGGVRVQSEVGQGSRFIMELPVNRQGADSAVSRT